MFFTQLIKSRYMYISECSYPMCGQFVLQLFHEIGRRVEDICSMRGVVVGI